MHREIKGISSMATRLLLAELVAAYGAVSDDKVVIESVGGVDAARRVQAGESFDVVFLASDAIAKLVASGHVVDGSQVNLVHSGVAVAVRAGAPQPAIATEEDVRRAVLGARTLSYSTGPSGVALARLFEHWGIADEIKGRIVQAPPGVPVGELVARGEVELGFQQLSELMHVKGITVLGPLPAAIQVTTTFAGGIVASSGHRDAVQSLLEFMCAPAAADAKRRQGMDPA